jgi:hypothetical protein
VGLWEEIKLFLLATRIRSTYPFTHTVCFLCFKLELSASIDFKLELKISCLFGFYFVLFLILHKRCAFERVRLSNQSSIMEVETGFGLRGVFQ